MTETPIFRTGVLPIIAYSETTANFVVILIGKVKNTVKYFEEVTQAHYDY